MAREKAEFLDGVGPAAKIFRLQSCALGDEAAPAPVVEVGDAGGREESAPVDDGQAQVHDPVAEHEPSFDGV
jgi:hypothetical protein